MEHDPLRYDDIAEQLYAPVYPVIARAALARTGKRSGRVLDAGCGGGHLGFAVLDLGEFESLTLLDESLQALERALERAGERGHAAKTSAQAHDICTVGLEDVGGRPFDLIVSRGSMPFWEDQAGAFSNLYRLLAPGGAGYVGGGMGSAALAEDIRARMAGIRAENGGEGPRLFDRSQSKALPDDAYLQLFSQLGGACDIVSNQDEGRWIVFRKPLG